MDPTTYVLITDTIARDNDYVGVVIINAAAWDCEDARGADRWGPCTKGYADH